MNYKFLHDRRRSIAFRVPVCGGAGLKGNGRRALENIRTLSESILLRGDDLVKAKMSARLR